MTKAERLQELKDQKKFHKLLDKIFDRDWKAWVSEIHRENELSNLRMYKILSILKGPEFVEDLVGLMGKKNRSARLEFTKFPKGIPVKDSRFKSIPELMIEKYPSGSYREGKVYVPVNCQRWVSFVF